MAESATHRKMVKRLEQWIVNNYDKSEKIFIWTDTPQNGPSSFPITIEGFVPDLYAKFLSSTEQIIGEAKTASDLDTQHTEKQITAFLRYCAINQNTILILAVPWDLVRYTRSLIKYWKRQSQIENVRTFVPENIEIS